MTASVTLSICGTASAVAMSASLSDGHEHEAVLVDEKILSRMEERRRADLLDHRRAGDPRPGHEVLAAMDRRRRRSRAGEPDGARAGRLRGAPRSKPRQRRLRRAAEGGDVEPDELD